MSLLDDTERAIDRGAAFLDRHAAQAKKLRLVKDNDTDISPEDCGIDPESFWKSELISKTDRAGQRSYPCRVHNLVLILENDPAWKGQFRFDEFRMKIIQGEQELIDHHLVALKAWLERHWIDSEVKTTVVREAVELVAHRHSFHPVREWLKGLVWDGVTRIPTFFQDFCGTPLTPYSTAVANSMFVSAIARVMQPGCKVDTMVVFEGAQGIGKSKLVQAMFGTRWHCDITQEPGSLDFYQNLRGKWIGEFSELSAMGKADQNRVKQALTQTQDTYRASYAHYSRTYPRQFIFTGNTNKADYLFDETGARRYLPIECHEINAEAVEPLRDQLWAEAVQRYQAGNIWWNIPDADREQEKRYQVDSWEDYVKPWLKGRAQVTMSEILEEALSLKIDRHDRSSQTRVGAILRRLGWVAKRDSTGDRQRYYVKKTRT
jgi:predicted P-loop ATPase